MGFLMERYRKWLIFSIIFLAIALAFPIIALYLQSTSTLRAFESTIIQPNWEASSPETFDDMNVRAARPKNIFRATRNRVSTICIDCSRY